MKKEEILLNEPEIVETKPNKVKIALSILASTLVVATITTLLVGHFKFDWFKSDEYKIDARINRSIYQANYFFSMGIGDWGLGIGDWGLGPLPNPQSPIPNPQSPIPNHI